MSEYSALVTVSEALRDMLREKLVGADPNVRAILSDKSQISLDPPYELSRDRRPRKSYLSVYLFRVQPSATSRNKPVVPAPATAQPNEPLALDLFYVITPLTNSSDNDQRLLGRTMKVFHDSPILVGGGPGLNGLLQPVTQQIRITQVSQSLEDLCDLWAAFRLPLRLSVSYALGPVLLN